MPVVVVMMVVMAVVGQNRTGEEDHRRDEYDPRDDRYPGREPVEPIRLGRLRV
ncbi:hypothetical protein [Mycobacterium sp.]|uniref:hypothetical protein n=1 Tax=Mycobacterium sp. TaxID=1785 RepID=UPI003D6B5D0E